MCLAKCSLLVKLSWQGGKSVQKKRCPFFFLDGGCESLFTLSLSEPSSSPSPSSSSASPISTSCAEVGVVARCERSLFNVGRSWSRWGVNGSSGSGRCPGTPAKLSRVGVHGFSGISCAGGSANVGLGVVGVCSSPDWWAAVALTMAWKGGERGQTRGQCLCEPDRRQTRFVVECR